MYGLDPALRGITCRLADLPCDLAAFMAMAICPLPGSTDVGPSLPIDMIDNDLPCLGRPSRGLLSPCCCSSSNKPFPPKGDVLSDRVGLCPFLKFCGKIRGFLEILGLVAAVNGAIFRCRSPTPFCWTARDGDRSASALRATFLKVMIHSTSSPANTVDWANWIETRMFEGGFEDMVGMARRRSSGFGVAVVLECHRRGSILFIFGDGGLTSS
jgi:hypothetical protein